jgi:predicted ArsR family transcriptional regulator
MTAQLLGAVRAQLPASAAQVAAKLGLTHEQTYEALVALEARDLASVYVQTPSRGPRVITWERT